MIRLSGHARRRAAHRVTPAPRSVDRLGAALTTRGLPVPRRLAAQVGATHRRGRSYLLLGHHLYVVAGQTVVTVLTLARESAEDLLATLLLVAAGLPVVWAREPVGGCRG